MAHPCWAEQTSWTHKESCALAARPEDALENHVEFDAVVLSTLNKNSTVVTKATAPVKISCQAMLTTLHLPPNLNNTSTPKSRLASSIALFTAAVRSAEGEVTIATEARVSRGLCLTAVQQPGFQGPSIPARTACRWGHHMPPLLSSVSNPDEVYPRAEAEAPIQRVVAVPALPSFVGWALHLSFDDSTDNDGEIHPDRANDEPTDCYLPCRAFKISLARADVPRFAAVTSVSVAAVLPRPVVTT